MVFLLGSIPGLDQPDDVVLYHRDTEGAGPFQRVQGSYDASAKSFTASTFRTGEYIAVYEACRVPYPIRPANGEQGVDVVSTLFEWSPAVQTQGYQLQVSTTADFTSTVIDVAVTQGEQHVGATLLASTWYFWRVRSRLTNGGTGPWSQPWRFRTGMPAPVPVEPGAAGDTVCATLQPRLSWTSVPGASAYHVRVVLGTSPGTVIVEDTTDQTSVVVPRLTSGSIFKWNVRAVDNGIAGAYSATAFFRTQPDVPTRVWPLTGNTSVPSDSLKLIWNSVDAATQYRVRCATQQGATVVIDTTIPTVWYYVGGLQPATTYRWTVQAVGSFCESPASEVAVFTTAAAGALAAPVPLAPMHEEKLQRTDVALSWRQPNATRWMVDVATDASMDSIVYTESDVTTTSLTVPASIIADSTTYYWRVRGWRSDQAGEPSAIVQFTTAAAPPPPVIGLTPLEPADGASGVSRSGVFVWSYDSRVDDYLVQLFTGASTTPVRSYSTADTTAPYSGLDAETAYRWNVTGRKTGVFAITGPDATFTTGNGGGTGIAFDDAPTEPDLLQARMECPADVAHVIVSDILGRVVDRSAVPITNGRLRYRLPNVGVLVVAVSACGTQLTFVRVVR